jgi:hypothetical protein
MDVFAQSIRSFAGDIALPCAAIIAHDMPCLRQVGSLLTDLRSGTKRTAAARELFGESGIFGK